MARVDREAYGRSMRCEKEAAERSDPEPPVAAVAGLAEFLQQAERALSLRRVYLFGSRARGDARADSDLDLAFEHDSSPAEWASFVNTARDEAPVLLDLDLVDLATAAPDLRERILKEGKMIRG